MKKKKKSGAGAGAGAGSVVAKWWLESSLSFLT